MCSLSPDSQKGIYIPGNFLKGKVGNLPGVVPSTPLRKFLTFPNWSQINGRKCRSGSKTSDSPPFKKDCVLHYPKLMKDLLGNSNVLQSQLEMAIYVDGCWKYIYLKPIFVKMHLNRFILFSGHIIFNVYSYMYL